MGAWTCRRSIRSPASTFRRYPTRFGPSSRPRRRLQPDSVRSMQLAVRNLASRAMATGRSGSVGPAESQADETLAMTVAHEVVARPPPHLPQADMAATVEVDRLRAHRPGSGSAGAPVTWRDRPGWNLPATAHEDVIVESAPGRAGRYSVPAFGFSPRMRARCSSTRVRNSGSLRNWSRSSSCSIQSRMCSLSLTRNASAKAL